MDTLRGRVAVVTGAASGMGRAVARRFAAEGALLVIADIDGATLSAVADELTAAGHDDVLAIEMMSLASTTGIGCAPRRCRATARCTSPT